MQAHKLSDIQIIRKKFLSIIFCKLLMTSPSQPPALWYISKPLIPYPEALEIMSAHQEAIIANNAPERVWLLEHPPLYTAGTSANPQDLLTKCFDVFQTGRGGQYTYHGPGQRVVYLMLDLNKRGRDVRRFIRQLENWLVLTLAHFNVIAKPQEDRIGLWVTDKSGKEAKIAAIGIRLRKWVSCHGIALNVNPNLAHFDGIVPCGIRQYGVTSLAHLGHNRLSMAKVDMALRSAFEEVFGPTQLAP